MTHSSASPVPTVFLAGTCGGDMWRTPFEATLETLGVSYFNPQVDDWEPWMAEEENRCMAHSPIVLFPVLRSTLGLGSLAEIGFSILATLRSIQQGQDRHLLVYIEEDVDPEVTIKEPQPDGSKLTVKAGPAIIAESIRTRQLVNTKLAQETWRHGVHVASSMDDLHAKMVALATTLDTKKAITG